MSDIFESLDDDLKKINKKKVYTTTITRVDVGDVEEEEEEELVDVDFSKLITEGKCCSDNKMDKFRSNTKRKDKQLKAFRNLMNIRRANPNE